MTAVQHQIDARNRPSETLRVRTLQSLEELRTITEEWELLLREYPLATTFSTPQWLMPWWKAFGANQRLLVLAFFDRNSRLCALAPLSIERIRSAGAVSLRVLRLMGDGSKDSDNLDLLVRPGYESAFADSLFAYLQEHGKSWDICQWNTMPPASPAMIAMDRLMGKKGWPATLQERPASIIPLPTAWNHYLERLSSEDRNNLGRYSRRLDKRYEVKIFRCTESHELDRCLEALFALHQARWNSAGHSGSFASTTRRQFYRELSSALLERDALDFWVLELDGTIAAAQFGFRYGSTVFQLQEGNDPRHASDRVGFVLRGHVIRELINQGITAYDFLGGVPGYKARWGAEERRYVYLQFARPLTLGAACLSAVSNAKSGKEWLRRHVSPNVWNTLHKVKMRVARKAPTDRPV